jgi:RNA polymerase sigma factor (sigma-70 family)
MGSSDEALLAGFAAGDQQAAAAFVRRFQRRAYGLARTIVGNPRDAEDVAQDAFLRAWRYAAGYDPRRGTVLTWLLTIVRNVAIDRLRLKSAEPLDPDVLAAKLQLERAREGRDEGSQLGEREHLREALAVLPVEQRRALLLAAYFGRTAREIAELEGVPLGTAKTRIRSAMISLRGRMEVGDDR